MPEIKYTCNLCDNSVTKIVFKKEDIVGYMTCCAEVEVAREEDGTVITRVCGGVMERALKAPTTKVVEVIDNGIMGRRVEQLKDVKEILEERSKDHDAQTKKDKP